MTTVARLAAGSLAVASFALAVRAAYHLDLWLLAGALVVMFGSLGMAVRS